MLVTKSFQNRARHVAYGHKAYGHKACFPHTVKLVTENLPLLTKSVPQFLGGTGRGYSLSLGLTSKLIKKIYM